MNRCRFGTVWRAMAPFAVALGLGTGCTVPGPRATEGAMGELARAEYRVELPGPGERERSVSFLRGGQRGAPRVIFVHGTPGDATAWADYLIDPPGHLEAIAIDRPGFGHSEPRHAVPRLIDQARALEPLLARRQDRDPILVGHSLGAAVVMRAAIEFPDRIAGLVIVAGSLDPDLERVLWIQRLGRWRGLEWILPRWARNANRELLALEEELRALSPRIAELQCPVVIVHGTEDPLVPFANVEFLRAKLAKHPRVELIRLEGYNHFLPWNAPGALRRAVERASALAGASRTEP